MNKAKLLLNSTIILVVVYIVMMYDTNSILNIVENAFYCKDHYVAIGNYHPRYDDKIGAKLILYDPENPENPHSIIYDHFGVPGSYYIRDYNNYSIDLQLKRLFVLHNFFDGYVWITYRIKVMDEDGSHMSGSGHIPVKMKIHRENWEWRVVQIWEKP